jgi:hypothetical protein
MFGKSVSRRFVGGSKKLVLFALALVIVLATLPVHPVQAWALTQVSGSVGGVHIYPVKIREQTVGSWNGIAVTALNFVGNGSTQIDRVPNRPGAQVVMLKYFVEKYTAQGWVTITTGPVISGVISATQNSITAAAPNFLLSSPGNGYFRLSTAVVWGNSSGATLGSTVVRSDRLADYVCNTGYNFSCYPYAGSVYLKGIYSN